MTNENVQPSQGFVPSQIENNSGQGKDSPVLDVVAKRFNWGVALGGPVAFFWGIFNQSYIPIIIFAVMFGVAILLAICLGIPFYHTVASKNDNLMLVIQMVKLLINLIFRLINIGLFFYFD